MVYVSQQGHWLILARHGDKLIDPSAGLSRKQAIGAGLCPAYAALW